MTTFIIIYVVNFLVQLAEGIGIGVACRKLDVDWDEMYANTYKHAPFGVYQAKQWYILIPDLLIFSPLLGHFMAAFMMMEAFKLYHAKEPE